MTVCVPDGVLTGSAGPLSSVTVVTNMFAFAYSGLVAPLGLSAFHVSPALFL